MHPLPACLIELIDSLAAGLPAADSRQKWKKLFLELRGELKSWLNFLIVEDEAERIEDLIRRLDSLNLAVASQDAQSLLSASLAFFPPYDAHHHLRSEAHFISVEAIDQLVLATCSAIKGLATFEVAWAKMPAAEQAVEGIRQLLRSSATFFSPAFYMEAESALHSFSEGIASLRLVRAGDEQSRLLQAFKCFQIGSEKIAPFLRLVDEVNDSSEFSIPLLGASLVELKRNFNDVALERLRNQDAPAFIKMWEEVTDGWLLPPSKLDELTENTDRAIIIFRQTLADYEADPKAFWTAVDDLNTSFLKIRSQALPVEIALESAFGPEAALLLGLLNRQIPDLAALNAIEGIRAGDVPKVLTQLADELEAYLQTREKKHLLAALGELIEDAR